MEMERKVFSDVETKGMDDFQVEALISTERRDRGGDILLADGMKITGTPVVLMAHGTGPMGQEPIAKPIFIKKTDTPKKGILARIQFFPDDVGKRLWKKIVEGYLVNWSIGWLPLKWDYRTEPGGERTRIVSEWELLELSPVAVGMNPEAQTVFAKSAWFKWVRPGEALQKGYGPLTLPKATKLQDLLPPCILQELYEKHVRCRVVPSVEKGRFAEYDIDRDEILLNGGADREAMASYYSRLLGRQVEAEAAFVLTIFHELAHWDRRKHLDAIKDCEPARAEAEREANAYAAKRFLDWKISPWDQQDYQQWKERLKYE